MSNERLDRRQALKKTGLFVGGSLSLPVLTSLLQGCKTPLDPDWTPSFFSVDESETLAHLAESIIPRTDTPGALDAKVHRYLDVMASEIFPAEQTTRFKSGLNGFMEMCASKFGEAYGALSADQKKEALDIASSTESSDGMNFFEIMKGMTIAGFFTSEVGAKEVLKFDPIPGEYQGCIPVEDVGGTWAI